MNTISLLAACLALALPACGPEAAADTALAAPAVAEPPADSPTGRAGPYRFDRPAARFELPPELVEVSALTVLGDGRLGAVQDEDGVLYVLSAETGAVEAAVPFGPPGDYEGVEAVGRRLFVLRADGAVLDLGATADFDGWAAAEGVRATVHETGLGAKACDAEGLGTDGARLLIACKEEGDGDRTPTYALDVGSMTLATGPALARADVPGGKKPRPSALAVHPVTGHTVVLASKGDALVSLDAEGAVVDVWDLAPAGLEQPEGLAFLPNGDALVSSEGRDGPGVVVRFAYEPTDR